MACGRQEQINFSLIRPKSGQQLTDIICVVKVTMQGHIQFLIKSFMRRVF